jgi:uncharacterized protein YbjT (DUF2867 family)
MTRTVVVFGGTGFLGRRVVRQVRDRLFAVRVASRHPEKAGDLFGSGDPQVLPVKADIHDERSVAAALAGAYAAVNAVSLYVERGEETFQSVHVAAAARLARAAHQAGLERLIHMSGIGADPASPSSYIRSRGEGEQVVRDAFPQATLIRPSVMFGPDDHFLNTMLNLLKRLPVYPMFGRGTTKLQPVHVEDVAEAIARTIERDDTKGTTFECGGPRVYAYEELLRTIAHTARLQVTLVPVPFAAWHVLAWMAEVLPGAALTRNQVELMEIDTVVSKDARGLADLGMQPRELEATLDVLALSKMAA